MQSTLRNIQANLHALFCSGPGHSHENGAKSKILNLYVSVQLGNSIQ